MKTNIVAPVGGLLILAGGLALAFYTGTNGSVLLETKAKAVEKYVALSEKALASGEASQAEKYAKEALALDPKSKKAIAEFKKVVLASCPATATSSSAAPAKQAAPAKAAQPKAESEDEMGCI